MPTTVNRPQWSPPLNGGSTPTHTFTDVTNIVPQWSPPSDGGSNPTGIEWIPPEDVPQWSPPSNGGSTRHPYPPGRRPS